MFITLGVCEVISGITSGILSKKFNLYILATLGTLIAEVSLILGFLTLFLNSGKYTICFFIAAIMGFSDCYFNSICQTICTRDYEGRIEIYGIFR